MALLALFSFKLSIFKDTILWFSATSEGADAELEAKLHFEKWRLFREALMQPSSSALKGLPVNILTETIEVFILCSALLEKKSIAYLKRTIAAGFLSFGYL